MLTYVANATFLFLQKEAKVFFAIFCPFRLIDKVSSFPALTLAVIDKYSPKIVTSVVYSDLFQSHCMSKPKNGKKPLIWPKNTRNIVNIFTYLTPNGLRNPTSSSKLKRPFTRPAVQMKPSKS